jgi:pimeloyl-ACP methyl ester carboxylesterase
VGVDEHTIEIAGASVFYRAAAGAAPDTLYLHSVPTSSDDWSELLALTGGVAPDLPGFGRSAKAGNIDNSLAAYVTFVEAFLDELDLHEVTIIGHGWGAAIGLMFALRQPDRVSRLAIINAIPLLPGFSWPASVRWVRRPGIGELIMGSVTRWILARQLRRGSVSDQAWPDARITSVWEQFDQGTQRAILRLYRSVDARTLAEAGDGLGDLHQPVLVVWGERDPWLAASFADAYAERLSGAAVRRVPGAGHWPWLDQPDLTAELAEFAAGPDAR